MATRQINGLDVPTAGTFTLDPAHTRVGFVARHLMVSKVRGSFTKVSGEIVVAENPAESTVHVSLDVESITTGVEQRDGHLRSGDFFELEKHPTIEFNSTGVTLGSGNEFTLNGTLTIKDTTLPVSLDGEFEGIVTSPYGKEVFGFSASTEIDREDWGITYNMALETGGVMISKNVKIEIEGEAIRND
ncbi:MAG TPA: YceI family protein [Micromonosporaceae bacterium]